MLYPMDKFQDQVCYIGSWNWWRNCATFPLPVCGHWYHQQLTNQVLVSIPAIALDASFGEITNMDETAAYDCQSNLRHEHARLLLPWVPKETWMVSEKQICDSTCRTNEWPLRTVLTGRWTPSRESGMPNFPYAVQGSCNDQGGSSEIFSKREFKEEWHTVVRTLQKRSLFDRTYRY